MSQLQLKSYEPKVEKNPSLTEVATKRTLPSRKAALFLRFFHNAGLKTDHQRSSPIKRIRVNC